jgi:hypothetical protein
LDRNQSSISAMVTTAMAGPSTDFTRTNVVVDLVVSAGDAKIGR